MKHCDDEFYDSFKDVIFHDNDGAIYVWREAWRKASINFSAILDSELRAVAEKIKGDLNETDK